MADDACAGCLSIGWTTGKRVIIPGQPNQSLTEDVSGYWEVCPGPSTKRIVAPGDERMESVMRTQAISKIVMYLEP